MFKSIAFAGFLLVVVHAQLPLTCLQSFDNDFRLCFKNNGGYQLETMFSLVTNGSSGPLPDDMANNKAGLLSSVCGNGEVLRGCITPVPDKVHVECNQQEQGMMRSTVDSMVRALSGMCGLAAPGPPACMAKFDSNFRSCLTKIGIVPDNFFMLVANQSLPRGINSEMLKNVTCSQPKQQNILNCASTAMGQLTQGCGQQEQMMVGATLKNLMGAYQSMCMGGGGVGVSPCLVRFEQSLEVCSTKTMNVDMKQMVILLARGEVPPNVDRDAMNASICSKWHEFEACGKKVVKASDCAQRDLLMVEATFANMMISIAAFCHDDSLPGACMLTLQKQFEECFTEVNLDPQLYFNNSTNKRGAILGSTQQLAEAYCGKRHDLYTCMRQVMHKCPGAEETLTLTGFDLTAMERALGILCNDIPEYLEGLSCFENPTPASRQCMEQMTQGITTLSTKQITRKLSMTSFFDDFCRVRVRHVGCDAKAWPLCDQRAVQVKNKFECHLLPDNCHDINEDDIIKICPNDAKPRTGAQCADHVKENIDKCFRRYNIEFYLFLVNVTHDRKTILGNGDAARKFCSERNDIFKCMKNTLNECSGAEDKLAYWGHQQTSLVRAINVLCNDLNTYEKGFDCMSNPNNRVQRCVSETTNRMTVLSGKSVTMELTPGDYYRDFCNIRVEHLKCDLRAWQPDCSNDVIGLKTEFECKLMQDRCNALERSAISQICNDQTFARSARRRNGATTGASGSNGAVSASIASSMIFLFAAALATLV